MTKLNVESFFNLALKEMTDARKERKWPEGKPLNHTGRTGGDNVITGCIFETGETSKVHTYPCHNPIHNFSNASVMWSCFAYNTSEKVARYYLNWLINSSPWSRTGIIPTRQTEEEMFNIGFIFEDLYNTPANLLHNFLIATRMAVEWPSFIECWYALIHNYNIDPSLAFVMLTVFNPPYNYATHTCLNEVSGCSLCTMDKYDWPLDMSRATEEYILNFIHGIPVGISSFMFSPNAETKPVNTLWGGLLDVSDKNTYVNRLKFEYSRLCKVNVIEYTQFGHSKMKKEVESFLFEDIITIIQLEQERLNINVRKAA